MAKDLSTKTGKKRGTGDYMMEKDDNLLAKTMNGPAKEFFSDIAELSLDEMIGMITKNQKLLQDIPIIKWLFIANDIRTIIQSAFFLKKYANFIGPINEAFGDELWQDRVINDLFTNKKDFSKQIDQTIISLDRYQNEMKAKLLGILFVETFNKKEFSLFEYNTLIFSIELMNPYSGIKCLKKYYDYYTEFTGSIEEETKRKIWAQGARLDYSPLASTGLLHLPSGAVVVGNLGGASINELGIKFYELVVSKMNIG
jgi:hypothetical protein